MYRAELLRLLEGHDWIWAAWWKALLELSPEQFKQEVGGSFPSVFTTTAHMVGAELVWQMRCEGQGQAVFPPLPENMLRLKEDWDEISRRRRVWLETVPLEQTVNYTFTGGTAANSISEVIVHMTSHAHFHRGQLVNHFRALGLKPPSVHMIGFFRL